MFVGDGRLEMLAFWAFAIAGLGKASLTQLRRRVAHAGIERGCFCVQIARESATRAAMNSPLATVEATVRRWFQRVHSLR